MDTSLDIQALETAFKQGVQFEHKQKFEEAFACYQVVADKGFVYGMYNLAWCFYEGKGTQVDQDKALYWMREAAHKNFDQAQLNTGIFYLNTVKTEEGNALAFMYIGLAAKQNNATAQRLLAEFYQKGVVIEKDSSKAFDWYLLSAEAGDMKAQHNTACMYQRADGVAQHHRKASLWFERAAKQGYQPSLQALNQLAKNKLNPYAKQTLAKLNFMKKVALL
ncbi:MAG: tetratricopeptide repeat protein [Legionellaceae bacterium]|nr:tetratricopeptide repeat protein [Legionellaceae bacterium]